MVSSAGGLAAVRHVLKHLPAGFPAAIVIVQHLDPRHRSQMAGILSRPTQLLVKEAAEGDRLCPGQVFLAPPNRHLLVNPDRSLSLSQSELVHFLRPSGDLLFESVAASHKARALALVLTGTGTDGAMGVRAGVVVLDENLTVVLWNHQIAELWGLRADEAKGKSFASLDIGLPVAELAGPIHTAINAGSHQTVTLNSVNRRGKPIACRVTCSPLRDGKAIHGVLLFMQEEQRKDEAATTADS